MTHVDGLSRIEYIGVIDDNSFERNLAVAQKCDNNIVALTRELELREDKLFELRNGVVYRKRNNILLFYVPQDMERNVLFRYHNELGHVGQGKVYETLSRNYWFPEMKKNN